MSGKFIVAITCALFLAGGAAAQEPDMAARMQAMETRMAELEAQLQRTTQSLQAAQQQLAAQQNAAAETTAASAAAAPAPAPAAESAAAAAEKGLPAFFQEVEVGGWVSASFNHNFNDPPGENLAGANSGGRAAANPFKADANSFSFDQLWFEIERPAAEPGSAGFRADIAYGKSAGLLSGANPDASSGNDFEIYQAYAQYLSPGGIALQAGKFATLIGAEVVQAPANYNITRGQVYNLFQPITHSGVLASGEAGALGWSVGLVNGTRNFPARDSDRNRGKAVLWALGGALGESASWNLAGTHGNADAGADADLPSGDRENIFDLILSWAPADNFEAYLNADYLSSENRAGGDTSGYGLAFAGKLALSKRSSLAGRFEYVDLETDGVGNAAADPFEMFTLTSTLAHELAGGLTLRGELRYDAISEAGGGRELFRGEEGPERNQLLGLVELIYGF